MTLALRPLVEAEIPAAVAVWKACRLVRPWNDPEADARRALAGPASTIIAAAFPERLIGTAMCGWDGHRGWVYYLGVVPGYRHRGIARALMHECEAWLAAHDAPKIQLMVREGNEEAVRFYRSIGYAEQQYRIFSRRLDTLAQPPLASTATV